MFEEYDLPSEQKCNRQQKQAPGIAAAHEEQRREHHGVIPVVDTAGAAALVLHKPALKRAEEKDTDHIADGVSAAEENHNAVVQNAAHMQCPEETVEDNPDQRNQNGCVVVRY